LNELIHINYKRIIIAEDSDSMRADLINILNNLGLTNISSYENGLDAYTALKNEAESGTPFDVLFTDINMPKMNGIVLLKLTREISLYKKIPIFVISTENEKDTVMKAIIGGATDYILKPYLQENVRSKLAKKLN